MKLSKEVSKRKKKKAMNPQRDQLSMEIQVRRRYATDWPKVILELIGRIQGVNNKWSMIMQAIMSCNDLRVTYARVNGGLEIVVSYNGDVETIRVEVEEVEESMQYIEVLVMDKISQSKLFQKAVDE